MHAVRSLDKEAPMQRFHDNSDHTDEGESQRWLPIILAAHGLILLVIVTLAVNYPAVSEWISAAAQAEFVNPDLTAAGPTQIAQPAEQMRIVRSN
jgi:hypothetical protein